MEAYLGVATVAAAREFWSMKPALMPPLASDRAAPAIA
jgi:hypothetical protein